jgi:hypothetical protein
MWVLCSHTTAFAAGASSPAPYRSSNRSSVSAMWQSRTFHDSGPPWTIAR